MYVVVCEESGCFGERIIDKVPFTNPREAMEYVGKAHRYLSRPWELVEFGGFDDGIHIFKTENIETYENSHNGDIREFRWYITEV